MAVRMANRRGWLVVVGVMTALVGANAIAQTDNAGFVSQSVPSTMVATQSQMVSVTMRNTGTTTWSYGQSYRLGTQNPQDNMIWTTDSRVNLDGADFIPPNGTKTFTFPITAPSVAGTYNFQFEMVREYVHWFGSPTVNVQITVTPYVPGDSSGNPPVAWWSFDDIYRGTTGTTSATDFSGNANTGTFSGTSLVAGVAGYARYFGTSTDYMSGTATSVLNISGPITLEAWVRAGSGDSDIMNKAPNQGSPANYPGNFDFYLISGNHLAFGHEIVGGGYRLYYSTATVATNQWSHVAVTWGAGRVRFYINGSLVTDVADSGETAVTASPVVRIGVRADGFAYHGAVDEVKIWNYARSAAQIAGTYKPLPTCTAAIVNPPPNPNYTSACINQPCTGLYPPDADASLQQCINVLTNNGTRPAEIRLAPGNPGYLISQTLVIPNNVVITSTDSSVRASLRAKESLWWPIVTNCQVRGLTQLQANYNCPPISGLAASFLRLDGNRTGRYLLYSQLCPPSSGRSLTGNIVIENGSSNLAIDDNESTRALCGSALLVNGSSYEVARNLVDDNGYGWETATNPPFPGQPWIQQGRQPWSDGITLEYCGGGSAFGNTVLDATDVGIAVFSTLQPCSIYQNSIQNRVRHAFGGTGLPAGNGPNVSVTNNAIAADLNRMSFGLIGGCHPWVPPTPDHPFPDPQTTTIGGQITNNAVSGAFVNLVVDGVSGATIQGNTLSNAQGNSNTCGAPSTSNYTMWAAHVLGSGYQSGWVAKSYDGCIPLP